VEISPKDYKKVKKLISAFGGNSWILKKERWSTKEGIPKITLRLVPRNKNGRKLIRMQKEAIEFGKFLQELPEDWFKRNKL